jgi:hypothetical protein
MFRAVKFLPALVMGLSFPAVMAADPGAAALDFLGKVRDGKIDLAPDADTALLEQTTERKRESIRERIERLTAELRGAELELGEVKLDGAFAAVVVRRAGGFDSADIQVHPVALVKRGERWLPAPVPGSFENSVAGYTLPLKARLAALEGWMALKRVTELEKLLTESAQRTRELIRGSIVGEDLEGDDLGRIADRFMAACAARDRAAILGFLGGLSEPLPADWQARLDASKAAVRGTGNWRMIVSPEVVRVTVHEEVDRRDGLVSVAWLDPFALESPKISLVHLAFSRDGDGRWRIDLPGVLLHGSKGSDDEGLDGDLLERFAERLAATAPPVGADTARGAWENLRESLRRADFPETLRSIDTISSTGKGNPACEAAAELWRTLHEPGTMRVPVELGFREDGDFAALACQWFLASDPDRFDLRTLFFHKTPRGWLWMPSPNLKKTNPELLRLSAWSGESEAGWRLGWRGVLLQPGVRLDGIAFGELPGDAEVVALAERWIEALDSRDLSAALAVSAWLGRDGEMPMKALRNISYEFANAGQGKTALAAIHRSASWTGLTLVRNAGGRVQRIFFPVVTTPGGFRLLPEIELIPEDTRSRNFLNRTSFERLDQYVGGDKVADLEKLFDASRKEIKVD